MARFVIATGIQPSEYKRMTVREVQAVVKVMTEERED